ncbi:MAG: glycosyltransferase [Flavobacteriaceae bacterium]|nr:glycosyltransferase [Flavobacteriaceae bacterium]|tara:strand:- start:17 stop:1069 length:1053 start_codon:yes stop_codon:yes gene_type:complete
MKILVIQQKMIGDVLTSSIICENIKKWNPNTKIDFIANANTISVLENNPYIDSIIVFENHYRSNKIAFINFLRNQRKKKYDIIIDVYGKIESILTTFWTKSAIKIGYNKWYTKLIYTNKINRERSLLKDGVQLSIKNRIKLLYPILGKDFNYSIKPKLYVSDFEKQKAISKLSNKSTKYLIMISALGSSITKTYPLIKMSKVLDFIVEKFDAELILNYIPNQKKQILKLLSKINSKTSNSIIISDAPNNLRDFIGLLSQCDAIIGNEGGSINMAKALDIPNFAIYSPQTDLDSWLNPSSKEVGVHINNYDITLKNTNLKTLNSNQIISLYNNFHFDLFKNKLFDFINQLR